MVPDWKKKHIAHLRATLNALNEPGRWVRYPENQRKYLEQRDEDEIVKTTIALMKAMGG